MDFQWPSTRLFTCDHAGMAEALAWMEGYVPALGCGSTTTRRARLVLDELYANTLLHGAGDSSSEGVEVAIERHGDQVRIYYGDGLAEFDTARAVLEATAPAGDRIGGAGLIILQRLCLSVSYTRYGSRNRIVLVMPVND